MSFIQEIKQSQSAFTSVIDSLQNDFTSEEMKLNVSDNSISEKFDKIVESIPERMTYKLAIELLNCSQKESARYHFMNPLNKNSDIDHIEQAIKIMIDYEFYGTRDNDLTISFLKQIPENDAKLMIAFGDRIDIKRTNTIKSFIELVSTKYADSEVSVENIKKIVAQESMGKCQLEILSKVIPTQETLRYHEFNIFDDSMPYNKIIEWLEIMNSFYYYDMIDEEKIRKFLSELSNDNKTKVNTFMRNFEPNKSNVNNNDDQDRSITFENTSKTINSDDLILYDLTDQ